MPDKKLFVETDRHGNPQFVFRRSYSHSYHRGDERANITREELNNMKERERNLRHQNEELTSINANLKANLQTLTQENERQAGLAAYYHREAQLLAAENRDLRRSLEIRSRAAEQHDQDMRNLRMKNTALKNSVDTKKEENDRLTTKIRELTRQLQDAMDQVRRLGKEVTGWRRRYDQASDDYEGAKLANAQFRIDNARLVSENNRLRDQLDSIARPRYRYP